MHIIPELKTILIYTPRTGSGTLKRLVQSTYPRSILLYRHMEADGVPQGYDRYKKIGVVRHPVDRLWSLFKYLRHFNHDPSVPFYEESYSLAMKQSVRRSFNDWIINNEWVFTNANDAQQGQYHYAEFSRRHTMPENRLSQFQYLRPDLGTDVIPFEGLGMLINRLGLSDALEAIGRSNTTSDDIPPVLSQHAAAHIEKFCAWEIEEFGYEVSWSQERIKAA